LPRCFRGRDVIRFALVSLSVVAALAGVMVLSDARADTKQPAITGEWTGKYICTQGITSLRLSIAQGEGQAITATFNFGPLPENPEVPRGAYRMAGTYDPATRRMMLSGVKWIDAPFGYVMVGLDGRMTSSGETISGHVPDLFGCTDFEIHRPVQLVG
jgi:hypothetical protein